MAKVGRKQKPYETSWGEIVAGLAKQGNDNRWRIVATGERFTEPDERRAIHRFRKKCPAAETIQVPVYDPASAKTNADVNAVLASRPETVIDPDDPDAPATIVRNVHAAALWRWFREQLLNDTTRAHVARMVGIPELNALRNLNIPGPAVPLSRILTTYRKENPAYKSGNVRPVKVFEQMMEHTGAKTLEELTHDSLGKWRNSIENSKTIKSAQTKRWMYGQVKAILAFNLKCPGSDSAAIRAALDRCKVLWTAGEMPPVQPKPIKRDHFHKLLEAAGETNWRAWLLLGLNAALYIEELCDLKWEHVDLEHGTLAMIRTKTRRKRIPRAATLWPETVVALGALKRTGCPYVFVSPTGTRYASSASRCNAFAELRTRAGLTEADVSFAQIRDGAFTAACSADIEDKWGRLLAGHRAEGLQDNYVLRHPEIVRPACDAVYAVYGPFPPAAN